MTDQEITEFLAARLGPILDEVIRLRREVANLSAASVLAEREACAKIAEEECDGHDLCGCSRIAEAIRARGGEQLHTAATSPR